ncbi:MAG: glycosyltransferase family 4 protein, partial [Chloroflexi bacterium]|nr:glycosyltransferase family 4 protein [Chloroflexota bacterium]
TSFFKDYGGHIRILEETLALQALGHQVTIVTYYKGDNMPGLDIRRTSALPYHAEYDVGSSRHKLAFDTYLAATTLAVGRRVWPDVVHGHMHEGALIGGALARLLRVPLLFDFQGGLTAEMIDHGFLNPDGRVYPWARRLEKFICHLPQAILTSSLRAADLLRREFSVPAERIHPLPDCVDLDRFDPGQFTEEAKNALRQKLGIPLGRPIVAYLGLLADYQGIPQLIEAAARLKLAGEDAHFLVMGYPRVEEYRALATAWQVADRVTFTGRVEYRDAPFYLSLGDVAVSAKVSATEGSGKVLNYMAMSQPVVAYDTPVHREYLADLGVYAPAGDVACLAACLQELIHNPQRCHCLGQKLRQRVAGRYNWQQAGEQITGIYARLVGGR